MSAFLAYAGATLLAAATLPQAVRLLRERGTDDFGWPFTALNFIGLALLAWRSWEIQEWGFLGVNVLTTAFWGLVLAFKITRVVNPRPPAAPTTLR